MIYKTISYVMIVLGGTISGAIVGLVTGPLDIRLYIDNMVATGACIGACFAVACRKFAVDRHQATEHNRELLRLSKGGSHEWPTTRNEPHCAHPQSLVRSDTFDSGRRQTSLAQRFHGGQPFLGF